MAGIPFETFVFYKVNRSAFLPQRGSNTGCWPFKFFVQWEDNVVNLAWHIRQETFFLQQLLERKLQPNQSHSIEAIPQTQNDEFSAAVETQITPKSLSLPWSSITDSKLCINCNNTFQEIHVMKYSLCSKLCRFDFLEHRNCYVSRHTLYLDA